MPVRDLVVDDLNVLGVSKVTISTATTTNFDFGTPDDINLVAATGPGATYEAGDKVLVIFRATTTGTTNAVSFSVQDANDSGGAIGTPATAVTQGSMAGGTGDQYAVVSVRVQSGRPWLRCRVTSNGATDTFVATALVLSVPRGLL